MGDADRVVILVRPWPRLKSNWQVAAVKLFKHGEWFRQTTVWYIRPLLKRELPETEECSRQVVDERKRMTKRTLSRTQRKS